MIRLLEDHKEWAKKYGIQLGNIECPYCKKEFELCVPVATGKYRGLTIKDHGCEGGRPYRVVSTDSEFNEMLRGLVSDVKESGPVA